MKKFVTTIVFFCAFAFGFSAVATGVWNYSHATETDDDGWTTVWEDDIQLYDWNVEGGPTIWYCYGDFAVYNLPRTDVDSVFGSVRTDWAFSTYNWSYYDPSMHTCETQSYKAFPSYWSCSGKEESGLDDEDYSYDEKDMRLYFKYSGVSDYYYYFYYHLR